MIKLVKSHINRSEFLKNSLTLITGIGIAQMIPIILQPILRRIFTPEDFGAFAVYMSVIGILSVVFMLRYQMSIVVPEKDSEAANIFFLVFIINLFFSFLALLIILIYKDELVNLLDFPEKYSYWLYFIPLSTFLFCNYDAMNFWLIRKKAFKSSAINKISRRSSEGLVHIIFSIFKKPLGLTIGDLVGNFINNISGLIQIKKNGLSLHVFDIRELIPLAKKYIEFPKNTIPALFNSAATLLPVLFINKIYSENITGYFDLSRLVLAVPGILISVAISNVLFQKITERKNKSLSIKNDLKQVFYILVLIGVLESIVILLFGPEIFTFVFGKDGTMSGIYSQILIFSYVFKFVISPLSIVLVALNKIKIVSIWQTIYFLAILSLLFFNNFIITEFLKIYVVIEIVSYVLYLILIINIVKKYEISLIKGSHDISAGK